MRPVTGLIAAAMLLAAAAPFAGAAASPRHEAIERLAAKAAGPADRADLRARAQKAQALTAVHLAGEADQPTLTLRTEGRPGATVFALDGGKRIVIDLEGALNLESCATIPGGDSPLVRQVRVSQYTASPRFITRVVLDLAMACSHETKDHADRLELTIAPKRAKAAAAERVVIDYDADAVEPTPGQLAQKLNMLRGEAPAASPAAPTPAADTRALAGRLAELRGEPAAVSAPLPPAEAVPETVVARRSAHALADDLLAVAETRVDLFTFRSATLATLEEEAAAEAAAPPANGNGAPTPPAPRSAEPEQAVDAAAANTSLLSAIGEYMKGERVAEAEGVVASKLADRPAPAPAAPAPKPYTGNPLDQLVNIDFREMELSNVVALLAHKAGINVIAGTELTGLVTANLRNVTLRQAMETALRMNDLGIVEEEGIFRIIPYSDAIAYKRESVVIELANAKSDEMQRVLREIIAGSPDERLVNIAADKAANVIVISGPQGKIGPLVQMAERLDVAEPVLPTVTEAISLNYAEPQQIVATVEKMLTEQVGSVAADPRARHLIVTDIPVVVENVRALVSKLDIPVKQVSIDAMVVDVNLQDGAETGVDWLVRSIQSQSRRQAALGTDPETGLPIGRALGTLQDLGAATALTGNPLAGALNFGILTQDIDWQGIIQAEIRNQRGRLLSNPVLVTIENQPAKIDITQEIPYVEVQQTNAGGSQTNTQFKNIGTVLQVTPRVTHDDDILVDIQAKESGTAGEFNGIPIEDKREIQTNLRVRSGNTIFIGGLRKQSKNTTIRKVPVLGDIPVMNVLFRQNNRREQVNELLIFLSCSVVRDQNELTPYQRERLADGKSIEINVDSQAALFHDALYPHKEADPLWKWRRGQ